MQTDTDIDTPTNTKPSLSAREEWTELFRTAVIAVILALIVRSLVAEPFNIPSGSMLPTLQIGDYLFVSKPAYGYSRYSFPFGLAPIDGRIATFGHVPRRGDVRRFQTADQYVGRLYQAADRPARRYDPDDGRAAVYQS